jgi:hypothetical protein
MTIFTQKTAFDLHLFDTYNTNKWKEMGASWKIYKDHMFELFVLPFWKTCMKCAQTAIFHVEI